ncbi:phosphate signaling complex protein PhoU [Streptacidiphilus anmyonensis]|uniref:phosphate signaling complex protein PhoU n=1 Tax=Streptacidiphilus anmyonensis TaxID=405782 RepID=UPI0005AB7DC8|nr:phosphate signaling complex protein PhoU [Streptacidiphilus anmyonensis]
MREAYHEELTAISNGLVGMARKVASAMEQATVALLEADLRLASAVIDDDRTVDRLHRELEDRAIALLARQQPVATELRIVVTALRISAEVERSGDLARHIAELARMRHPARAVPADLQDTVGSMGELARRLMLQAADVIASRNVEDALMLEQADQQMNELHRTVFEQLRETNWQHGIETAVDVALAARYCERYADHATSLADRVVYLVTGQHIDQPSHMLALAE